MLVSKTQARRALLGLRRSTRDRDLAAAIETLEDQLEYRYGSFFPFNSASRGNKDLLDILRQGTRRNRYRLRGQPLLEMGSKSEVDELDWSDNRPLLQIILEIADMAYTAYALRGRNGSVGWGMLGHGFSRTALSVVQSDENEVELLIGQLETAATELMKRAEAALAQPAETPQLALIRQEFYFLQDNGGTEADFCQLLTAPESDLLTPAEIVLLHTLMADPKRPRRCSWQTAAKSKLGVLPAAACDDGWPPKPNLRVLPGLPRQRRAQPTRRKLAAIA